MTADQHIVVVALGRDLADQVRDYVWALVEKGTQVDLVVASPSSWSRADHERWTVIAANPRVTVHHLDGADRRHFLRRLERTVIHRVPAALLKSVRAKSWQRKYSRLALTFHRKIFIRSWRIFQPWLMAGMFRKRLGTVDFTTVDRIVAADIYGLTLGWRLARRHPDIPATRALDTA